MKLYFDFFLQSLHDKDSAQGFGGLFLMISSTFIADFSFIIGALTAIAGLILVIFNILVKHKEYVRLNQEEERRDQELAREELELMEDYKDEENTRP